MVYYLYGTDWVRGKFCVDELREAHAESRRMQFDIAEEWDGFCQALQTELRSRSLFGAHAFIVAKTDKLTKEQLKALSAMDPESAEGTVVVWELNARPSWKPKSKKVTVKEFNELSAAGARTWVAEYLKKKGLSVPHDFLEMLFTVFGTRLDFMVQEIEKYTLLRAAAVPVGAQDGIVGPGNEQSFFEWIRSVLEHDVSGIEQHAPSQEQFMQYLAGLMNAVRTVMLARARVAQQGVNPYWARKLERWASARTDASLQKLFGFLLELDLDIRAGKGDMEHAVTLIKTRLITDA